MMIVFLIFFFILLAIYALIKTSGKSKNHIQEDYEQMEYLSKHYNKRDKAGH